MNSFVIRHMVLKILYIGSQISEISCSYTNYAFWQFRCFSFALANVLVSVLRPHPTASAISRWVKLKFFSWKNFLCLAIVNASLNELAANDVNSILKVTLLMLHLSRSESTKDSVNLHHLFWCIHFREVILCLTLLKQ